jgi:hypothetical protein
MTTWKEAFNAFRCERYEAEKLKERRDFIIRELMKNPRAVNTGRTHKLFKEIDEYTFTVEKCEIIRKR